MALKGMNKVSASRVPQLASPIIASSNEFISVFIKATVGQRKDMTFQFLDKLELLLPLLLDFLDQLYIEMSLYFLLWL